jgi:hypothetical protein
MSSPAHTLELPGHQGSLRWGASVAPFRLLLAFALAAAFGGVLVHHGGLHFPAYTDEVQFWEQTRLFAEDWFPPISELRDYGQPMTPAAFLAWAAVERYTGSGLAGGRLLNLLAALVTVFAIAWRRGDTTRAGALAVCGLLVFPYFVGLSIHLYTDVFATLFVVLGVRFYWTRRLALSAIAFVLAIATRQYMVVFPLAMLADRGFQGLRGESWSWSEILSPLLAAGSLLAWIAFFGGAGPAAGLERYPLHTTAWHGGPSYALYFLACIGGYFVFAEMVLFGTWRGIDRLWTLRNAIIACVVLSLFALHPPIFPDDYLGPLNRVMHWALPDVALRIGVLYVLAVAACIRFARIDASLFLILANLLVYLNSASWEKYLLPLMAALWAMRALAADEADVRADAGADEEREEARLILRPIPLLRRAPGGAALLTVGLDRVAQRSRAAHRADSGPLFDRYPTEAGELVSHMGGR